MYGKCIVSAGEEGSKKNNIGQRNEKEKKMYKMMKRGCKDIQIAEEKNETKITGTTKKS